MATENAKSNKWAIVLNAPKEKTDKRTTLAGYQTLIKDYNAFSFSASIIHDKDLLEDGELKTIHAHVYIETPNKLTKKAFLTLLAELLSIDEIQISIEPTGNEFLSVQYLIHKNDKSKTQYLETDILTTDLNILATKLTRVYEQALDDDRILAFIEGSPTLTDFTRKVGLSIANKYRNIYKDMKQERFAYDVTMRDIEKCERLNLLESELVNLTNYLTTTRHDDATKLTYIRHVLDRLKLVD